MADEIVNKVAQSGIETIDLEQWIADLPLEVLDIKDHLFQGLILREKDFRAFVSEHNWEQYSQKRLAVFCSTDAVIPTWAYMLVTKACAPYTQEIYFASPQECAALIAERSLANFPVEKFTDARVVIKGCGHRELSNHAYVCLSTKLLPLVKSLMFGEPCSTVPIYKKR